MLMSSVDPRDYILHYFLSWSIWVYLCWKRLRRYKTTLPRVPELYIHIRRRLNQDLIGTDNRNLLKFHVFTLVKILRLLGEIALMYTMSC